MRDGNHDGGQGLDVLGPDELGLLRALDAHLLSWADELGAVEQRYPFLMTPSDLDAIDYYDNFPHLGLAVAQADPEQLEKALAGVDRPVTVLPAPVLREIRYQLPSAACYGVWFALRGATLSAGGSLFTTVATCFRNEDHYEGLRRLLGFSMREIVFAGQAEGAQAHLTRSKERVLSLADRLGLKMTTETATDPFFDRNGSRARMQMLFPVKEEFVVDGLAIGSVNYHRNFFGERCDFRLDDDTAAHTSCLAFGLERWVHVLAKRHGSAGAAADAVRELT
ncbi:hypothetical protein ACIQVL_47145 [Streptomyces sp. NPDC090499]|uniref:hypothetical protein n=1 Tax=Streptomyces sp. NPDC090499 TaxID=3365965 RepID=UPI0038240211